VIGVALLVFTELAEARGAMMPERGGSMITLTYGGSTRVLPNYNVMGVAKAALEASVALSRCRFRSRAIFASTPSRGPIRTLAGAGIAEQREMLKFQQTPCAAAAHRHDR